MSPSTRLEQQHMDRSTWHCHKTLLVKRRETPCDDTIQLVDCAKRARRFSNYFYIGVYFQKLVWTQFKIKMQNASFANPLVPSHCTTTCILLLSVYAFNLPVYRQPVDTPTDASPSASFIFKGLRRSQASIYRNTWLAYNRPGIPHQRNTLKRLISSVPSLFARPTT